MSDIYFTLEKRNDKNGQNLDTIIRHENGKPDDEWCTVADLDRLFEACSTRWSTNGWDLDKLIVCIRECEFD